MRISRWWASLAVWSTVFVVESPADSPQNWTFDLATTGNNVFWTSPSAVPPDADRFDATITVTLLEVRVQYLIFSFTLDVTDQIPPEYRVTNTSAPGPAPQELVNQPITYPDPPEPPAISGTLHVAINAAGFGQASFTDVVLGTATVTLPGFGTQTVTVTRVRVVGDVSIKPVFFQTGDMNCDGEVTVSDIGAFVLALTNPSEYQLQFPGCSLLNADVNGDSAVTVGDIGGFVALLTGG